MSFLPAVAALTGFKPPMFDEILAAVPPLVGPIHSIFYAYILIMVPHVLRVTLTMMQPSEKGGYSNINPRGEAFRELAV
jgi:hypothetical protein